MKRSYILFLLLCAVGFTITSCADDEVVNTPTQLESKIISDFQADAVAPYTGHFSLFSLRDNTAVSIADSASTKWDLGFRGTTIIINGGTSGPGVGAAQVVSGIFDEVKEAPASGYGQDNGTTYAITTGSDKGWYHYDAATNIITPIAGKILIIKTADGKYAKMEILSYYQGAPAVPDATSKSRHYKFRFIYQSDGSTKLN
jgi:hypothetical protein